jgi:hypothetical protein
MNIIESFLDKIQTEKLDTADIVRKSNKLFMKVYQDAVEHCIVKQKREEYSSVKPDMDCEEKAQIIAYRRLLTRLDLWIDRCADAQCKQTMSSQRNKIQTRFNYLQRRQPLTKPLPELPD